MATPRKAPEDKLKIGRPTQYKVDYVDMAFKFCLAFKATDKDLAVRFGVCEDTIYEWKNKYPDFSEAIKKGGEVADAEVANALWKRACGYSHQDVDIKMYEGHIIETPFTKYYPPDTGAAMAWLKNRQKEFWRDTKDIDMGNKDDKPFVQTINVITQEAVKEMVDSVESDY